MMRTPLENCKQKIEQYVSSCFNCNKKVYIFNENLRDGLECYSVHLCVQFELVQT